MDFLWRSVRNLCAICGASSLTLSGRREEKKSPFHARARENYTYTVDKNIRREKKDGTESKYYNWRDLCDGK